MVRLASVELSRPAPSRLGRWDYGATNGLKVTVQGLYKADDVTANPSHATDQLVIAWPYETSKAVLALQTTVDAGTPEVDSDNLVRISEMPLRQAEAAIIEYADLLGVAYQCRRVVRSPNPCVALLGDTEDEWQRLEAAAGIYCPSTYRPRAVLLPELGPGTRMGESVADRMDGLALLADSLSEIGPVGQVQTLFRVFERAFAEGPGACIDPLLAFLSSSTQDFGWTRDELKDWFQRLRPEVMHADRREEYARATDVAPLLSRIEFAAYDVLFNKETWRDKDTGRRDAVQLSAGVEADNSVLRVLRPDATVIAPWVDPFGTFVTDFGSQITVGGRAITTMPGAFEQPGVYVARLQVRPSYSGGDGQVVEMQLLTHHSQSSAPARTASPSRKRALRGSG